MRTKIIKIFKVLIFLALCIWFAAFLARKIDLTTADLGRHIKNGEIIIHAPWPEKLAVLKTNYYSYTQPEFPFVNHHWGSGVVFYFIFQLGGFVGVSVFYVFLGVLAFALYLMLAIKRAGWLISIALALLLAPLMASRGEVRPEVFTYLFCGVFFWMISEYVQSNSKKSKIQPLLSRPLSQRAGHSLHVLERGIWLLPLVMLFWVNLHIGFIFGIFILGAFGLVELIRLILKKQNAFWPFFRIGILTAAAACFNPFGIKGLLYPFNIFRQYGYMIVENQSVRFLEKLGVTSTMNFGLYKMALAVAAGSVILVLILAIYEKFSPTTPSGRRGEYAWAENLIMLALGILGLFGIRHFPSFAFMALPVIAGNVSCLYRINQRSTVSKTTFGTRKAIIYPLAFFVILISIVRGVNQITYYKSVLGFGLMPQINRSADFFKQMKIQGPVFNNYDIGGYLIFNTLIPRGSKTAAADFNADKTIFVDNRPEAYSVDFFEKVYKPMQQDDAVWKKISEEYKFNSVFFSHRDYTPWGQQFLLSRVKDPDWAVVYYDSYAIIMLKRGEQNRAIIEKYEIPKSIFVVN